MLLDSVLEFITQAASSSAFIFCFCNLIIVIILVDFKPSLSTHQQSEITPYKGVNQKQGEHREKDITSLPQAVEIEVSHDQEVEAAESIEIEANDDSCKEEEEQIREKKNEDLGDDNNYDNEDDELKRRVEEFIKKVNKGWKEELLSTSSLA